MLAQPPLALVALLAACTGASAPQWGALPAVTLEPDGPGQVLDAAAWLADDGDGHPFITAQGSAGVLAQVYGGRLSLHPLLGYRGDTTIDLVVEDRQGRSDSASLAVHVGTGDGPVAGSCPVHLEWSARGGATTTAVQLSGEAADAVVASGGSPSLVDGGDGSWTLDVELPPGAASYGFVETIQSSQDTQDQAWCDPQADQVICPEGQASTWESQGGYACDQPDPLCLGVLVVPDCGLPQLTVSALSINRAAGSVSAQVETTLALDQAAIASASATLDGLAVDAWDGSAFHVEQSSLSPGRHTLRLAVTDVEGHSSPPAWIPFWTDETDPDQGWRAGSMYYAFTDRLADGDPGNDGTEGGTTALADYMGGDWVGTLALLPYLDDLGVRTLWISNPQDNADGAWDGSCEAVYAGYHAYWPVASREVEPHFGTPEELQALVDAAHTRGMRVVMDWVGNHVHQDHPYATEHPEWFNPQALCEDTTGSEQNWTAIPETCSFAPYLPDLDYSRTDVMETMLDDAMWWAQTFDLDGLRVDAAKHMPHSVQYDLNRRIAREIEHRAAGGDEQFWTVGETFDSADRIAAYVGPDELDGQFDFPLYYAVRDALGTRAGSLSDLSGSMNDSAGRYGDALMSSFLGNHDVTRFFTEVVEGGRDICDGDPLAQAGIPDSSGWADQRQAVAFAFLLTRPDVPLIYYGDELAMPGYGDPDNRQPWWWLTGGIPAEASVDGVAAQLDADRAALVQTVAGIGRARREHPALYSGVETQWWIDDDILAWGRVSGDDAALVILNPSDNDRWLSNGLSFAGLPTGGSWRDVVSGQVIDAAGDQITVEVGPRNSRVLVAE